MGTSAGAQTMNFKKYTSADGLSDNTVLCALRDSYGFMWLGTSNGLNRFDGRENTIYRNMIEESATYENNIITSLFEHNGDIWFGGSFGLYVFHRYDNSFSRFDKPTNYGVIISSTVQRIMQGPDSLIWIGTLGQGLFIFNPRTQQLLQDSRHGAFITDVVTTDNGNVAAVTLQGTILIYRYDGTFMEQYSIPDYVSDKKTISLEHLPHQLFIGTDRGLYHLIAGQAPPRRLSIPGMPTDIRTLRMKNSNELLCGTDQGIFIYNIGTGEARRYDASANAKSSLSDVIINGLLWDRDSTLWVMTEMGGVNYLPNQRSYAQAFHLPQDLAHSQRKMVRAVCEAADGNLWVGTDEGLFYYDRTKQILSSAGLPNIRQEINVLMLDGDDLWIGTRHEGIIVLNTQTRQLRHYQYSVDKPYTVTSNEINSLLRTRSGDIYVGTSWSLCRFDRETENFMWFAEIGTMTNVTHLCEDLHGCVWVASSNHGVFQQVSPRGGFRNYNYNRQQPTSITSNYVSTVFCDHSGYIWVATKGNGLCRFLSESAGFERFGSEGTVLQEKQVYFIVEDKHHNLWLGSEDGLLVVDSLRQASKVSILPDNSNIQYSQKPLNSAIITSSGDIFAGRYDMLVRFKPENIVFSNERHPLYILSVTLPYHSDDNGLDNHTLYTVNKLTLPFADNSFTLHFSSPRFTQMNATRFEYMLTGVDNNWARGTQNAEATYANVPPGNYEFVLREAGSDDQSDYARLRITVLPPWYRTTLAYLLYTLLLLLIIAWVIWRYNLVLKRRYNRRMRIFQAKQEKENFESKIRFFINLVHEIRTPLSLINLPLEAIEQDVEDEEEKEPSTLHSSLKKHTTAIRRNMNYLLGITNQLLDFQKAENGSVQLNLKNCDIGELLHDIYLQFSDAMTVQSKSIQLQLPEQPIITSIDIDKIQKVMMNLVGNAVKYARSEVIVRLEQVAMEQLCISVIDDGPGVPPTERDKIFDLYYQIGHDDVANTLGTGLGLSYAKMLAHAHEGDLQVKDAVGGGSNFMLTLPIRLEKGETTDELRTLATESVSDETEVISPTRTFHILIVEDNEELLLMTSDALRQHFHVLKARDGIEALDVLKHHDVDIIVSDVMMPRMDGIELCQKVKQDIEYSHIPVILLTAKTSVEAKLEGMKSGAEIYLEKPFSAKQLHLQITSLLRMRQQFYERMRNLDQIPINSTSDDELGMTHQDLLFLERLQRLIDENMRDEEFSIDILAEQMNMSRSSFYRKIKALTDQTPIEYLKTRRLEAAAHLLRQGSRINEVAERIGFSSSSYFAKCFRQKFGMLPKEYADNGGAAAE